MGSSPSPERQPQWLQRFSECGDIKALRGAKENPCLSPLIGTFSIRYEITVSLLIVGRVVHLDLVYCWFLILYCMCSVILVFDLTFPDDGIYL